MSQVFYEPVCRNDPDTPGQLKCDEQRYFKASKYKMYLIVNQQQ